MAEGEDKEGGGGEKEYEASEQKLRKAREKGNVPLSNDFNTFLTIIGYNLLFFAMVLLFRQIFLKLRPFFAHCGELEITIKSAQDIAFYLFKEIFLLAICVFISLTLSSVIGTLSQTKLNFSAEKLKMKLSNISPMNGIKKIFSLKAVIEFVKNILKTTIFIVISYYILKKYILKIEKYISLDLFGQLEKARDVITIILFIFAIVIMFFALVDFFLKRFMYKKEMKMSHKELVDEQKESEVDPHVKAKLRQIRMQRSKERVASAVKSSTFVVTNPTHFAVALKYELNQETAPIVVAKGADFMAQAIKSVAKENNIPIFENKLLARSLYKTTNVGDEIPETEYAAVAEIVRKVLNL